MNYGHFAMAWLQKHNLFNKDADYNGLVGVWVHELTKKIMSQGHSGASFAITMAIFDKLNKDYMNVKSDTWREYYTSEDGQRQLDLYGVTYENLCKVAEHDSKTNTMD